MLDQEKRKKFGNQKKERKKEKVFLTKMELQSPNPIKFFAYIQ